MIVGGSADLSESLGCPKGGFTKEIEPTFAGKKVSHVESCRALVSVMKMNIRDIYR